MREHVVDLVKVQTEMRVQDGPFSGMIMPETTSWGGDGDIAPKLLGSYEEELHTQIDELARRKYDAIVDVGCAEGYYAVGLARLFRDVTVFAYDTDPAALQVARKCAELNGIGASVVTGGHFDVEELLTLTEKHPRALVVVDCEGCEFDLLVNERSVKALEHSDIIVECHDFIVPGVTPEIIRSYLGTHKIKLVYQQGRNPNKYNFLSSLPDLDRWEAVNENRAQLMHWVVLEAFNPVALEVAGKSLEANWLFRIQELERRAKWREASALWRKKADEFWGLAWAKYEETWQLPDSDLTEAATVRATVEELWRLWLEALGDEPISVPPPATEG